jgi:drug/metabolite transporter (DMT)-like permease
VLVDITMLWWRRPPAWGAWVGIALAFGGTVLLSGPSAVNWAFGAGDALTIGSAVAITMEILLLSRLSPGCDPGRLAFVQTLTVAMLCLPVAWWRGEGLPQPAPGLLVLVVGLAAMTALIQTAMSWAQQAVSATRATLIYSLEPVWAGLVGWIAGERLGWLGLTGGALIVAGLVAPELLRARPRARGG